MAETNGGGEETSIFREKSFRLLRNILVEVWWSNDQDSMWAELKGVVR